MTDKFLDQSFRDGVDWYISLSSRFTPAEMKLLWTLVRACGETVSHADLAEAVTGRKFNSDDVIKVHINRLRKQAGDLALVIESVRGVGYKLSTPMGAAA